MSTMQVLIEVYLIVSAVGTEVSVIKSPVCGAIPDRFGFWL